MDKKVVMITGAGSGIGRATAHQFLGLGWRVVLVGRRLEPLRETAALNQDHCCVVGMDASEKKTIDARLPELLEAFGQIDALVLNAGLAPSIPISDTSWETLEQTMNVNAIGPAYIVAKLFEHLCARKGSVVLVSSLASIDPFAGFLAYGASKAAANSLARSIAVEGAESGVRAYAVAPGAVETPMLRTLFDQETIPPDRALDPGVIAETIVDCVLGRVTVENGETIPVPSP